MPEKTIIVLGSTNTDMVIRGKRIPAPGETVSGGTFQMNPGGKGANQAVAVARLGNPRALKCVFIAKVGDDRGESISPCSCRRPRPPCRGPVPGYRWLSEVAQNSLLLTQR